MKTNAQQGIGALFLLVAALGAQASGTTLSLGVTPGGFVDPTCHAGGEQLTVDVVAGAADPGTTGGQFLLTYDPACVTVLAVQPGNVCNPSSPFEILVFSEIDNPPGTIFASVGIAPGGIPATDGALLACITLEKNPACGACDICFDSVNPENTYLTNALGEPVPAKLPNDGCSAEFRAVGSIAVLCPSSVATNSDCDGDTAFVQWDPVGAVDSCDGALTMNCSAIHDGGADVTALIWSGGVFPEGVSSFFCTTTSSCGVVDTCQWYVAVDDQLTVDITIQVSPTWVGGMGERCIELTFFPDCVQTPTVTQTVVTFDIPPNAPGMATTTLKVPRANYACVTARDPLHTLRSVATPTCESNGHLSVDFSGDPSFGGNWLVGGNFDRSPNVDILDFGVLVSQYLTVVNPNNTCGQTANLGFKHADANGDGVVDIVDLTFIMINFIDSDKDSCCEEGVAGVEPPRLAVSLAELYATDRGYMAPADLNHDSWLTTADIAALLAGALPEPPHSKLVIPGPLDDDNAAD